MEINSSVDNESMAAPFLTTHYTRVQWRCDKIVARMDQSNDEIYEENVSMAGAAATSSGASGSESNAMPSTPSSPSTATRRSRHIAVAFDGSPSSLSALTLAFENLIHSSDKLTILVGVSNYDGGLEDLLKDIKCNALHTPNGHTVTFTSHASLSSPEKQFKARQVSATVKQVLCGLHAVHQKIIHTTIKVFWGCPKKIICEEVMKTRIHTLVVGSGGKSLCKTVFLGSTGVYLLANAKAQVIVVRASLDQK